MTDLDADIAELKTDRNWLRADITEIKKSLETLTVSIVGNGKPGIANRVARAETHIKIQWAVLFVAVAAIMTKIVCKAIAP